jgi:hypothetical protein
MRKFSLVIAVLLLTATAWADVKIIAEQDSGDPYRAVIKYEVTSEPNLVRAFALDIKVTVGDANIIEVNDFTPGDNNAGYGVYPSMFDAHINVDGDGNVTNWDDEDYTPEADPADDGTEPGLGTGGLTVELGSLYTDNPPGDSGTLCSVKVDAECTICVSLNAARGNIVMEDAAPPDGTVNLDDACVELGAACPCWGDGPDADVPQKVSAADVSGLAFLIYMNGGAPENGWTANVYPDEYKCMDVNDDKVLSAADVSAIAFHIYMNGGAPENGWTADICHPGP